MSKNHKRNNTTTTTNNIVNDKGTYFTEFLKSTQNKVHYFDSQSFNLWNYLKVEMFGVGEPGKLEPPSQEDITNFFLVPMHLESLIFLGVSICIDAFLYVITYLPIRVVFSSYLLIVEIQKSWLPNIYSQFGIIIDSKGDKNEEVKQLKFSFHRTHFYDLMRGAMFLVGCMALRSINMSQVYHFIRGQGIIKLYVLTAMLEIFDRLLSTFGQDAFDSLHRHTRFNPKSMQLFFTFLMVTVYVCLHSIVYFMHVATVTVVINSVDTTLITVLILNNFKEIRSFVMKKFDCHNLFQLACSDIVERFQMFLFLFLILIVQLSQAGLSMFWETLFTFTKIAGMMLIGECLADWIKHAFINKFNSINASVYQDFSYVLRNDMLSNQKDEIILDHTYSVTRRLGLSQIPLGCVCVRYLLLALTTPYVQIYISKQTQISLIVQGIIFFICLVSLKIMIGVGLVFYCAGAHKRDAQIFSRNPSTAVVVDHSNNNSSNSHIKAKSELQHSLSSSVLNNYNTGVDQLIDASNTTTTTTNHGTILQPNSLQRVLSDSGMGGIGGNMEGNNSNTTITTTTTGGGGALTTPHTNNLKPRSNSISNPFLDMHIVTEDISKVLAAATISKSTNKFTLTNTTQQQQQSSDININNDILDEILTNKTMITTTATTTAMIGGTPPLSPTRQFRRSVSIIEPVTISKIIFNHSNDNLCSINDNSNPELHIQVENKEEIEPNLLKILERTKSEEIEATRMIERLDFMETLSSIERYTVHNGRVV